MTSLQRIADRVAEGGALSDADAALLFDAHDLIAIATIADDVRRQMHGAAATFVRVCEVHVDAVPDALPSTHHAGEVRIVGIPASLEAACAAVASARVLAGHLPLTGFSLADIAPFSIADATAYRRLREAGLEAIADVPLDGMSSPAEAVTAARSAGLLVPRLTVQHPAGDPAALFREASGLQQATGGFRAFAPLPRILSIAEPTTGYDDVKVVAVARLMVRNIPSIQVDWPLYGPKLAQVALTVGADDVDGVAAVETGGLGPRRGAFEEITRNIRVASREPVERDGRFDRIGAGGRAR